MKAQEPAETLQTTSQVWQLVDTIAVEKWKMEFDPRAPKVARKYFCHGSLSYDLTYGPRKAVAEVSKHNEPIGRKSGIQLVRKIRKSMDFTFSCFVLN